jgi:peptidoglycan/LPS O-acetylase OafA/YrhL
MGKSHRFASYNASASIGSYQYVARIGRNQNAMNRGISSLDGLPARSIGFVLLAHLSGTRGFFRVNLSELGEFGVLVFLVISGYLITSLLLLAFLQPRK